MPALPYPTTEAVTEAEREHLEAQREHAAAEAQLRALQTTVQAGGDVEPSALTEAKARIEHAGLRIEAKHRRLAQARFDARKSALADIAQEVDEFDDEGGTQRLFADIVAIQDAVNAFIDHSRAYDARVAGWVKAAGALQAERHPYGQVPGADQAHVAVQPVRGTSGGIQAGTTILGRVDVLHVIAELCHALELHPYGPGRVDLTGWGAQVVASLRRTLDPSTPIAHDRSTPAHFRNS